MCALALHKRLGAVAAALLLAVTGAPVPGHAQSQNEEMTAVAPDKPAESALAGYRLGTGDRIRLIVYGEPNLTGEFGIDGSGFLGVPLIGKVKAGNATAEELEKRIAHELSQGYLKDPSVTVEIVKYRPFYIVGEVKQPGGYPYVSGMTVINAVALSGGFTYRAEEDEFKIKRRVGGKVTAIEAEPGTEVLPGDVVTVDERFF